MEWRHHREFYRIPYPTIARPWLVVQSYEFEVMDVSERGLRFKVGSVVPPAPGEGVAGTVRFRRGEEVQVSGVILRIEDGEAAVQLEQGIPLRVVLDEQRFLLERPRGLIR
jgi:PilZ domain-containing protein